VKSASIILPLYKWGTDEKHRLSDLCENHKKAVLLLGMEIRCH